MAGGIDATMIAALGFATFVGGMIYLKVPGMVTKALDDQSKKIADELSEAKRLRVEAEALRQGYETQRVQAEADAAAIVAKAKEDAERLKVEGEAQLRISIANRARQAEDRIARAEESAIAQVKAAAATAAIAAAQEVLVTGAKGKAGEKLIKGSISALETRLG
jgi:F-type H+-transporting ATPase subunit b